MHKSSHQPESQPDFGAEFHSESLAPICYEGRIGQANGRHDIIFLSSYIHDGTFRLDQVSLRRKTLVIPLERDRWELFRKLNELKSIRSELRITHVLSLRMELTDDALGGKFFQNPQVIISNLQLVTDQWEHSGDMELILNLVREARIRIRIAEESSIRLIDLAA
jgi:hypothetical protein